MCSKLTLHFFSIEHRPFPCSKIPFTQIVISGVLEHGGECFRKKFCYWLCPKNKTNHPISSNSHPSANANKAIHCLKCGGGGLQKEQEHPNILIKYVA